MNFDDLKRIYLFSFSNLINRPLIKPDYVGVLLTKRCNLKCKMCDIRKSPTSEIEELSFEEIKKIIDDIDSWGVETLTLTGGEPLLRKDFFKIADYAMNKVKHTAINTNLTLINREIAEEICDLPYHKFHLEISLDGATSETHDSIRGVSGTFDRIIKGIKLIREISKQSNTDVKIGVTFVLMEENIKEVMDLVKLADDLNFNNVSIMPALISNVKLQERGNKAYMNEESLQELDRIVEEVIEFKKKYGLVINPITSLKLYRKYFNGDLYNPGICNAGYMGPNIVEDGETYICTYSIGNIKQTNIKDIWYSKKANKIRKLTAKCEKPCLQHYSIRFHETNPFKATYFYIKEKLEKSNILE